MLLKLFYGRCYKIAYNVWVFAKAGYLLIAQPGTNAYLKCVIEDKNKSLKLKVKPEPLLCRSWPLLSSPPMRCFNKQRMWECSLKAYAYCLPAGRRPCLGE